MGQRQDVVLQAFTELAPSYEATLEREVREFCGLGYREFIGYLAERVPDAGDALILDLASGTALSSLEIAQRRGGRIIALDFTPEMQRFGAQNIQKSGMVARISQVCASGMELPFDSDVFDVVICGLGMHHMDASRLLAEIQRVLKGYGTMILADMGAPVGWRSLLGRVLVKSIVRVARLLWRTARVQAEADALDNIRTAAEWHQLLHEYGFARVEITEWPPRRFWYPCALIIRAVREGEA
jgi:ubiquinone/menaquinone biosynthesis C-methylase UbiE